MPNETEEKLEKEQDDGDGDENEELEAAEDDGDEGEDGEDDNEGDDGPHPGELIAQAQQEIADQLKRLESRNAGNLKFELVNNVYPIILGILDPLLHWMATIEEDLDELMADEPEGTEAIDPEMQKAIEEGAKKVIGVCEKIVELEKTPNDPILMKDVSAWAKETLASSKQVITQKE